ncbi:TRAP transporter large permease [Acidiphilium iwatense]|uniref:TRAP transporter large permease protein n=1 Tax=Acidiphilium iwatense TaxID=768198 RepID=A0ABS9DZY4_9PROT|nr:TRAP transporter large permease [Acidiphilium iwatense]MCF3948321.1 TRAP transporter large permease [Acidiphilium iwatense]
MAWSGDATLITLVFGMFGLMVLGVPIFISIGVTAFAGLALMFGIDQASVDFASFLWQSLNKFELVTIPLFVFAAMLVQAARLGDELFEFAKVCIGAVPNGLGVAVILTCAIFAGITGSSPVTAVTVGLIALPALAREGYPDRVRGALIAGGGTLGILLPPSLPLIIYGVLTETSIGSLFMATVIPGLLLALLFSLYVIFFNRPAIKVRPYVWRERWPILLKGAPIVVLPVFIIVSIYFGVVTPTETGAVAAMYILLVGLIRRRLNLKSILAAAMNAALTASMLLLIFGTGSVFARYSALLQLPQKIAAGVTSLPGGPLIAFTGIIVTDLFLGTFLESGALTILTIPIFFPIARAIGIDPVQFGVIIAVNQEIAQIHPPAGLNLVTVASISDIPLTQMMASILPFIAIEIVMVYALYLFPNLTLFLPNHMSMP